MIHIRYYLSKENQPSFTTKNSFTALSTERRYLVVVSKNYQQQQINQKH